MLFRSTFFSGDLLEEVYVVQPPSFELLGQEHKVCKLHKALYGVKQAPRAWYAKIDAFLGSKGLLDGPIESTLYIKKDGGDILIIILYVDDMLLTSNNEGKFADFKFELRATFDMLDMVMLHLYLGIQFVQNKYGIIMSQ